MISRDGCGYCEKALSFFNLLSIPVTINKVVSDEDRQWFIREGHRTFPRIYKNGKLIGGYEELIKYTADVIGNK